MLDAEELLRRYSVVDRTEPHLRVNFIASIDGAATHGGVTGPLNNPDDKQVFDALRMLSDVVVVGAGTVRAEGYGPLRLTGDAVEWRLAHGLAAHPVLAVVSARLLGLRGLPAFVDAPVRPLVLTGEAAPAEARAALSGAADVLSCGTTAADPALIRAALARRGLPQILCEGGPHLLGSLIAADAVDEVCLTISPLLEGGDAGRISVGGLQTTRRMRLVHAVPSGDMLLLRYGRAGERPAPL